jgi:tetratricopeptide (TPR) repeat protein
MGMFGDSREEELKIPGRRRVCPSCNEMYGSEALVCPEDGSGLLEVPDAPLLTGTCLESRYDIGGVVGTGGMGVVYRAHQRAMEREVAIKVLHPEYSHNPRAVKRFFREAQAASRLVHPHVVSVYDFGRSADGHLYMVMELLEGWTLGDLIHHRSPLSPGTAVVIATQICEALEAAHGHRIVHRDLKPDNVQLVAREGSVLAKVLDFGIARIMKDPDADLGLNLSTVDIAGTPAYMSPEQIMGKDPDPRTDLYSLGVILYEMLTGKRPFSDDNSVTLCMKQLNDAPPDIEEHIGPGVIPEDVKTIVQQLLYKDAAQRPASAGAVAKALLKTRVCDRELATQWTGSDQVGDGGDVLPTRPDIGAIMMLPTQHGFDACVAGLVARRGASSDAPPPETPEVENEGCETCGQSLEAGRKKCSRCGDQRGLAAEDLLAAPEREEDDKPQGVAVAIGVLLGGAESDFDVPRVAAWLRERRAEGWEVQRRHSAVAIRIPSTLRIQRRHATRLMLCRLEAMRLIVQETQVAIRMGLAEPGGQSEPDLRDLVKRLAASGSHGDVVIPSELATDLGLRRRTITSIFLPSGRAVPCAAVSEHSSSEVTQPVARGREREVRQLERLWEKASRRGPVLARVSGPRGVGLTTLLQAFVSARTHHYVRVAPRAHSWPGHTVARIALACLGLPETSDNSVIEARLEPLPGNLRDQLRLLLLDSEHSDEATEASLIQALVDIVSWRAGDQPFVLAVDDAHLLDAASAHLLAELRGAVTGRPWLIVLGEHTENAGAVRGVLGEDHFVELRPLGLRASTQLLERLQVAPARRPGLLALAQGNPLTLELLAAFDISGMKLRPGQIIPALLPELLRQLDPAEAESAWLDAFYGEVEVPSRLTTRAARLYLEVGLPAELERWLSGRVRCAEGLRANLERSFQDSGASAQWRAHRLERLGLWRLAVVEAEHALDRGVQNAGMLELDMALWEARSAEYDGAVARLTRVLSHRPAGLKADALVSFASVLLEAGETHRAEEVLEQARRMLSDATGTVAFGEVWALLARCAIRRSDLRGAMTQIGRGREAQALVETMDTRAARYLNALLQEVRAEIALAERDLGGARANLRQARDTFRDLGRPRDALRCLIDLGRTELDDQDTRLACDTLRAAVKMAGASGYVAEHRRAQICLGEALVSAGEVDDGAAILRRVLRDSRRGRRDVRSLHAAACAMAIAMVARDLPQDAVRYAELGLSCASHSAARARACLVLADAQVADGQPRLALRALREAIDAASATGQGAILQLAEDRVAALDLGPEAFSIFAEAAAG